MDCSECRQILSARLDDEASGEESLRASGHVSGCEACRRYEQDLAVLTRDLRAWPDEIPGAFRERPERSERILRAAAAAAILAAAVGSGFFAGRASATRHVASVEPARRPYARQSFRIYPVRNEVHSTWVLGPAGRDGD